jgi:hypothetical protein
MSINLHCFIFCYGGDLKSTFDSVKNQCCAISVLSHKLREDFQYYISDRSGYHHIFFDKPFEYELDSLIKEIESDFYIILYAGTTIDNIAATLDKYCQNNKLSLVKPKDCLNLMIVNARAHLYYEGNGPVKENEIDNNGETGFYQTIQDKIEIAAKNNNQEYLILESIDKLYELSK